MTSCFTVIVSAKNVVEVERTSDGKKEIIFRDTTGHRKFLTQKEIDAFHKDQHYKKILHNFLNWGDLITNTEMNNAYGDNVDEGTPRVSKQNGYKQKIQYFFNSIINNNAHDAAIENVERPQRASLPSYVPVYPLTSGMTLINDISIFSGYCRDNVNLYNMLDSKNDDLLFLIFAPSNEAIASLELKPWQFPIDINSLEAEFEQGMRTASELDDAVRDNVNKFVYNHVVMIDMEEQEKQDSANVYDSKNSVDLSKPNSSLIYENLDGKKLILRRDGLKFTVRLADADIENEIPIQDIECSNNGCIFVLGGSLETPKK
ncbi:uncharacterized protein SCDLUD_004883 [Saccharomycodes ludwigii]|nr:hypothetical protein SCDLUD_004883 [Saccharomycodes ludwigii]KAH3899440.1 hypothetical protein SCDLUD_004883 [Saccharomycodes ludwigii]